MGCAESNKMLRNEMGRKKMEKCPFTKNGGVGVAAWFE